MKSLFRLFLLVLFALWSICCSENETDIIEVTSVAISTKTVEMTVGETLQLSASVEPKNATDKEVSWSSSDDTVVSISKSGPEHLAAAQKAAEECGFYPVLKA